jgi:branched-chain amino acid transport system substrate-binding protein
MELTKPLTIVLAVVFLVAGVGIGYVIPRAGVVVSGGLQGEIPIGVCLTLTGSFGSYGGRAKAAVEIAQSEINDFVSKAGIPVTFKFYIEDTETKPDVALTKVQSLAARSIKVIIGGMISGEVKSIAGYVDSNKIVVIDGTSVAPRAVVAPPGDYVFRTLPTCEYEAVALVAAMIEKGYTHVGALVTKDTYSLAIQDAFEEKYKAAGGEVFARIEYAPGTMEFSAELDALEKAVATAVDKYGADKVAVFANVWEEVALILNEADKRNSPLLDLTWWGTDCLALSTVVTSQAGPLAAKVQLPSVLFDAPTTDRYNKLVQEAKSRIGEELDIYAIGTYDSAWIAALSILTAGKYDGEAVKKVVPYVAYNYYGASGNTVIQADGDRAVMNLAFYSVVEEAGKYEWKKIAVFDATTNEMKWLR